MREYEWNRQLIDQLTRMAQPDSRDRAALAVLRRGLTGPVDGTLARVGWLFPGVPSNYLDEAVRVAGLFAWVRGRCPQVAGRSLGEALGLGLTEEDRKRREKRLVDLLNTDAQELPYKLRQLLTLLERGEVGLDWCQLLQDLHFWSAPERRVQKRWARGFWGSPSSESGVTASSKIAE